MQDVPGININSSGHDPLNTVQDPVEAAQALFRRTLSNWVGDLLVLRQSGMLKMTWHTAGDELPAYRAAA